MRPSSARAQRHADQIALFADQRAARRGAGHYAGRRISDCADRQRADRGQLQLHGAVSLRVVPGSRSVGGRLRVVAAISRTTRPAATAARFAKNANFASFHSNLFISTSTRGSAMNLQIVQDGGSFSAGLYDFAMTVERHGNELSIDASLRRGAPLSRCGRTRSSVVRTSDLRLQPRRIPFRQLAERRPDHVQQYRRHDRSHPVGASAHPAGDDHGPNAGATRIVNTLAESITFNYYEIASEWGSLTPTGWSSRDDHEGGDAQTVGWDEAGGPTRFCCRRSTSHSSTTLAAGESLSLGRAFVVGPWPDLDFGYGVPDSDDLVTGNVEFVPGGPAGDFDGDGDVDDVDLAQWSDDLGVGGGSDADGDLRSDGADFLAWQRTLGTAGSWHRRGSARAGRPCNLVRCAIFDLSMRERNRIACLIVSERMVPSACLLTMFRSFAIVPAAGVSRRMGAAEVAVADRGAGRLLSVCWRVGRPVA